MDNQNSPHKTMDVQKLICLCCKEKVTMDKSFKMQYKEHITDRRINTADWQHGGPYKLPQTFSIKGKQDNWWA